MAFKRRKTGKNNKRKSPAFVFTFWSFALAVAITLLLAWGLEWPYLLSYLLAINLATVFFYGYDKMASRLDRFRIPEKTLHLLAFAGGTPGAILSQRFFRHKTVKGSFRKLFWLLTAIQVAVIAAALWYFFLRPPS